VRSDGPFSAPRLLQRASPFIGASIMAIALRPGDSLSTPSWTHSTALVLSALLIISPLWRSHLQRLPRLLQPLPASLALGLSGLPLPGSLFQVPSAYAVLALAIGVPFAMDAVPWGRVPRWAETVALLGSVSPLLLSRPQSHEAELIALPTLNIVVLFIALYGNRLELVAGVTLAALHFGLPQAGESFTAAELIRDAVLTSLTTIVAVCVFQVVTVMRAQRLVILEDERQANLRESWIQSILENTADALVTIDLHGTILAINRAARSMFGYQDRQLVGRPISVFIASQGQADFGSYLAARMRHQDAGIGSGARETTGIRSDLETFPIEYSAGETEHSGNRVFIVSLRDITDRKAKNAALEHQALHDPLTGLPNRILLEDRLAQTLSQSKRNGRGMALLMLDFNNFKGVNDEFGHDVGDGLLRQISYRLARTLRSGDTVARLGGDEFVVVPADVTSPEHAVRIAKKILEAASQPVHIDGHEIEAGVSIGIAMHPADGVDAVSLLRSADQAMYLAKRAGTGYSLATPVAAGAEAV